MVGAKAVSVATSVSEWIAGPAPEERSIERAFSPRHLGMADSWGVAPGYNVNGPSVLIPTQLSTGSYERERVDACRAPMAHSITARDNAPGNGHASISKGQRPVLCVPHPQGGLKWQVRDLPYFKRHPCMRFGAAPTARSITAWGNAPGNGSTPNFRGPTARPMDRAFSPRRVGMPQSWGVAPSCYGCGPLVLIPSQRCNGSHRAFTLIELLVVIGLIAALGTVFALGLKGGGRATALASAQSLLANLVGTVRLKAVTTGHETRLLLNTDPVSDPHSARFLRYLVWQERVADEWRTLGEAWLPEGVGLLPRDPRTPSNLFAPGGAWTRADGTALRSTALQTAGDLRLAVNSSVTENWASLGFTAAGTTFSNGDLVLATLEPLPPGSYVPGESPFQFTNPENVRGLSLSRYGLASLVSGRMGF